MDYNSESFASSYPDMTSSSDSLRLAFETDDFPLSLQPIIKRITLSTATLGIEFIGAIGDASVPVIRR